MIIPMSRIRILGSKASTMAVLKRLQEDGRVHIDSRIPDRRLLGDRFRLRRLAVGVETEHTREVLERLREKVKMLLLSLPPSPARGSSAAVEPDFGLRAGMEGSAFSKLEARLDGLVARVARLSSRRSAYEDDLSLLERYEKVLRALAPLIVKIKETRDLEYMGLVIQSSDRAVLDGLEKSLSRLTEGRYEIFYKEADPENLAALLVFPKEDAGRVNAVISQENIGRLRLPESVTEKPFNQALKIILRKQVELPLKIRLVQRELGEISRRWRDVLEGYRRNLDDRIGQILAADSIFETRMAFLVYGWMPRKAVPALAGRIREEFGGQVLLEELALPPNEEVPVILWNPSPIRPFEQFTRLLPLPRYGSIDPTPLIAGFFPLFFGMIIGDIGYGLLLSAAALWTRFHYRENRMVRDLATIFLAGSVSSVLWGAVYGEFFGNLGERFGLHPILIDRMEDFVLTLYIALAMGVIHILLGIGLGILTAVWNKDRREVIAKSSGLLVLFGVLAAAGGILGFLPAYAVTAGLLTVVAGLPVLFIGGGPAGAMELHNLVNIMSYLRLMGIGVASVALAFAANTLAGMVENVLLGILIGFTLHAVNLIFAVFSPTIQSLRLHYVEFFENFFRGGGREYRPFGRAT